MNTPVVLWMGMRAIRWLLWISFLLFSLHYLLFPNGHLDQFGHLLTSTEMALFGLGLAATFAGMFELALRGYAGLAQPRFGRIMAAKSTGPLANR